MLPGLTPVMMMGAGPTFPDLQFLGLSESTGLSVGGVPFDTPHSTRRVIVAVHFAAQFATSDSTTINGVTIGGVPATLHAVQKSRHTGNNELVVVAIASALVASGESGTVSISLQSGGGLQTRTLSVGSFVTYQSLTSINTDSSSSEGADTTNITLSVADGDCAIAAGSAFRGVLAVSLNVSGLAGGADAYDNNVNNTILVSGAQFGFDLSASSDLITATSATPTGIVLCGMAWQPS